MIDLMYFSASVPLIAIERSMHLRELVTVRNCHPQPPLWSAIFAKAFALAADETAALRQSYFRFPFPHLYEYGESMVTIAYEMSVGGEAIVLPVRVRSPDKMSLNAIRSKIVEMADDDLWQRGFYRTFAAVSYLPVFLRRPIWWIVLNIPRSRKRCFGTFAITSVGALGADLLTPRAPITSVLTYGPLDDDGILRVRLLFDHRVYDGGTAARVLARLEELLLGPVHDEIKPPPSILSETNPFANEPADVSTSTAPAAAGSMSLPSR
jgi:hypothetical protein